MLPHFMTIGNHSNNFYPSLPNQLFLNTETLMLGIRPSNIGLRTSGTVSNF